MMLKNLLIRLFLFILVISPLNAGDWPTGGALTSTATNWTGGPISSKQSGTNYTWKYTDSHGIKNFTVTSAHHNVFVYGYQIYQAYDTTVTQTIGPDSYGIFYKLSAVGDRGTVSISTSGTISPKYVVLGIMYDVPGVGSTCNYGIGQKFGVSSTVSSAFSSSYGISVGFGASAGVAGASNSLSATWEQSIDNSSSMSIDKSYNTTRSIHGLSDSINHDNDVIWIWVNPTINIYATPNNIIWNYGSDMTDPVGQMHVVSVKVSELKNPTTMLSGNAVALQRTWSSSGALTSEDYAQILSANPFWNGSTTINLNRFTLQEGQTVNFGSNISTQILSTTNTASSQNLTETNAFSVGFSAQVGVSLILNGSLTATGKLTWTNTIQNSTNQSFEKSASLFLQPSQATYNGPTVFMVYRDNIYGTFLLVPAP